MENFHLVFDVRASCFDTYQAIVLQLNHWWTTSTEDASVVGAEFTNRFGATFNRLRVEELEAASKVRWRVVAQHHSSNSLAKVDEWNDTEIQWRLKRINDNCTRIEFTHVGLTRSLDCWTICDEGWKFFLLESLKPLLETGQGKPFVHS